VKTNRDLSIERLLRRSLQTQGPPSGDCPDAEALAALADGALSAAERQIVETHVADCHRCQALTAAMLRTIPASPGAGDDRAASPWWKRRRTLNWLVPATAAATALALWVAVPGQRSPAPEERKAEVQTAAAPPPAPADASADALRSRLDQPADKQARDNEAGAAVGSTVSANAQPAAAPVDSLSKENENSLKLQEGVASEQVSVTPEPDRSRQDRTAPLTAARASAPAAAPAGFEVPSTDPLVRWRVGPGVVVQYSADGGSTWTPQETGASTPLTGGSSPSPLVCWLVGRAGAVLRSVDGGRQWQRVAFPEAADLIAVRASSALAATVDLADGRRVGTTDGGQTWTAVPK
jgi:Putative zinc-finger